MTDNQVSREHVAKRASLKFWMVTAGVTFLILLIGLLTWLHLHVQS
jgi:hypothetical protein